MLKLLVIAGCVTTEIVSCSLPAPPALFAVIVT